MFDVQEPLVHARKCILIIVNALACMRPCMPSKSAAPTLALWCCMHNFSSNVHDSFADSQIIMSWHPAKLTIMALSFRHG